MNFIDLLVFLCALAAGVRGFRRGLALEGIEAASAFGAIALAYAVRQRWGTALAVSTGLAEGLSRGAAFLGTALAAASLGFALAGWLSRKVPEAGPWAAADGIGGLLFGALKGTAYAALLLVLAAQIPAGFIVDWTYGSAVFRAIFALLPDLFANLDGWLQ